MGGGSRSVVGADMLGMGESESEPRPVSMTIEVSPALARVTDESLSGFVVYKSAIRNAPVKVAP